jgi:uncharacterized protein (DUF697 family)
MHDLDRTQNYYESEFDPEMFEFADEGEFGDEYEGEYGYEAEGPLDEVEEMESAAQMLEITDEAELDQFLGSLFKKVSRGAGKFLKSDIGRTLGGVLKGVAKTALPVAGGAIGSFIAPGVGTAFGSKVGSAASGFFGLELEGLSPQDQEYEVARRFVRFATAAAKKAHQLQSLLPADAAARKAVLEAAQKHAPGLLQALGGFQQALGGLNFEAGPQGMPAPSNGGGQAQSGRSGRWVRRGRKIILLGV